jgi:uncharacterized membrane protein YkoI
MMTIQNMIRAFLVVLALTVGSSTAQSGMTGPCYEDWSEAGPVVRTEGLLPVAKVLKRILRGRQGKVIKVQLCGVRGEFSYNIALSAKGGSITWLTVDALTGRIQPLVRP